MSSAIRSRYVFCGRFCGPACRRAICCCIRWAAPRGWACLRRRLNLLPGGQLDGGHILYSVASKHHKKITMGVALLLVPLGYFFWRGWILWSILLLAIGFRHPPLLNHWEQLDRKRLVWAGIAVLIFVLCFMPMPVLIR